MGDYIEIGIRTLMGKSNIIPSHLRLLSPTRYIYIRKKLDNIILNTESGSGEISTFLNQNGIYRS